MILGFALFDNVKFPEGLSLRIVSTIELRVAAWCRYNFECRIRYVFRYLTIEGKLGTAIDLNVRHDVFVFFRQMAQ